MRVTFSLSSRRSRVRLPSGAWGGVPRSSGLCRLQSGLRGRKSKCGAAGFRAAPGRSATSVSHFCLISAWEAERLSVLLGELRQFAYRDAQGGGDVADRGPGRVGVAALDQRERRDRDVGALGDDLLGLATLLAELAYRQSERRLR